MTIKHFRGIEDLTVANLSRVNLIVGRNNTGKTTLLEALLLLGGASSASPATRLGVLRGQSDADDPGIWIGLFGAQDAKIPIEIVGRNATRERRLRVTASTGAAAEDGLLRAASNPNQVRRKQPEPGWPRHEPVGRASAERARRGWRTEWRRGGGMAEDRASVQDKSLISFTSTSGTELVIAPGP
jgi:hypothetical protein